MFTSAGSQNSIVSSHVSMPDISASIGSEENQLLQNEVDSLTRDVHTVSQRLQTTQEGEMCFYYLQQRRRYMFLPVFVCPSVCLLARLLKNLMKCCMSTDVGTWTNWLTFEPDPDYSPDAGTGLLSLISCRLQNFAQPCLSASDLSCYAEFYIWKLPRMVRR